MVATYSTFGNYLLLKERSQDGLGSLWRAGEMERLGFKRIVWLRRFDQANLNRTALATEASVVNQLGQSFRATNVARNAVCGTDGGVPFLAWDYVPSQPLDQLLVRVQQEQFPVAIDNALLIAEKMSAALAAALQVEVRGEALVHGFLVPQMVLVGNDGEAMVAGFGLARGFLANLDRVGVRQMSAPYLAPEVLGGAAPSKRTDVYSLGAILFQLLCGSPLPEDPAARVPALAAPQLACDEGPVPADVLAILHKSLATRAEERLPSAAEFKRELEKLLYGGAYSPTTFNLALFMDRLYRQEIEEEDAELQREKSLDVTPYVKQPVADSGPASAVEAPAPSSQNRTVLFAALGAVAVLLAVVGYLLFFRTPPAQTVDSETVKRMVQEELTKYAQREKELNDQLAAERARTEEMQRKIEADKQAAQSGKKPLTADEQARIDRQKRELDARLAEQRRKEAELANLREQRARAEAQAAAAQPKPTPVTVATAAPPPVVAQPTAQVGFTAPTAVIPTAVSEPTPIPPTEPPAQAPPAEPAVREGDMVDFTQVDVQPQILKDVRPTLPRAAVMAKVNRAGVVILRALVDERGTVKDVQVMRGFPVARLGIDEACQEAVKQYLYRPAMKSGVKVKTWTTVTVAVDLTRTR
ncbi:MAG: protein kinase domain-containing protein [Acidobacteriota bacterium]